MDPYKILGIDRSATPDEIRAAYRAKAAKFHPDAGGETWAFQQVLEAYRSLTGEPKKRRNPKTPNNASPGETGENYGTGASKGKTQGQSQSAESTTVEIDIDLASSKGARNRKRKNGNRNEIAGIVAGGVCALLVGAFFLYWRSSVIDNSAQTAAQSNQTASQAQSAKKENKREARNNRNSRIPEVQNPAPEVSTTNRNDKKKLETQEKDTESQVAVEEKNNADVIQNPDQVPDALPRQPEDSAKPTGPIDDSRIGLTRDGLLSSAEVVLQQSGTLVDLKVGAWLSIEPPIGVTDVPDDFSGLQFWRFDDKYNRSAGFQTLKAGNVFMALPGAAFYEKVGLDQVRKTESRDRYFDDGWESIGKILSDGGLDEKVEWEIIGKTFRAGETSNVSIDSNVSPRLILGNPNVSDPNDRSKPIDIFQILQSLFDDVRVASQEQLEVKHRERLQEIWEEFTDNVNGKRVELVFKIRNIRQVSKSAYELTFDLLESGYFDQRQFIGQVYLPQSWLIDEWSAKQVESLSADSRISVNGFLQILADHDRIDFSRQRRLRHAFSVNIRSGSFTFDCAIKSAKIRIVDEIIDQKMNPDATKADATDTAEIDSPDTVKIDSPFGVIEFSGGPPADQLETIQNSDGSTTVRLKERK